METGSKADVAYVRLRDKILRGELAPGTVIPQRDVASEIGVSTTPLREGLRRLASEGLIDFGDRKIARVRALRTDDARNLLEVRRSLDPLAAGLAAERRTNADLAEIREAAGGLAALSVDPEISDLLAHRRFHRAIYLSSQNDVLIGVLDRLWDQADRYRLLALREHDRGQAARDQKDKEHRLLVEHIAARDAAAASRIMLQHIDTSLAVTAIQELDT